MLHRGFAPSPTASTPVAGRSAVVTYLAHSALPYHSAGYSTRTQGLVGGIRKCGYAAEVVTRLGYPRDFESFWHADLPGGEVIDGVPYRRLACDPSRLLPLSTDGYLRANIEATLQAVRAIRPAIVHGASNYITGLTAVHVARALGVPSLYEVRGLWEMTALSRDPAYRETLHFAQAVRLETDACLAADRVITITEALKRALVSRGVPDQKIVVVPNGVEPGRFRSRPPQKALAQKLGIAEGDVVIGYVGSVLHYEGLDDLLRAFRVCLGRGVTGLRLLIVGDGAALGDCVKLARSLELDRHVVFTGRVPHEVVEDYYALIDVAPFPRKPLPVCEMVSPLKPFEAMAMAKCVIVSGVAALAEIIGDRPIGLVHQKGSAESLARCLERAAKDRDLRLRLGTNARDYVVKERDWSVLARRVTDLYDELTCRRAKLAS